MCEFLVLVSLGVRAVQARADRRFVRRRWSAHLAVVTELNVATKRFGPGRRPSHSDQRCGAGQSLRLHHPSPIVRSVVRNTVRPIVLFCQGC